MAVYKRNKLRTAAEIIRKIKNWPTALKLRLCRNEPGLRLLEFRDGLYVNVRGGTRDWDVVHELFFAGGYAKAMEWLKGREEKKPRILDLGGNIGLFSLLVARTHSGALVTAYEPGPPNFRIFRMNILANGGLSERITLHEQAVAGAAGEAIWHFDAANPGGSSLYTTEGKGEEVKVSITAFAQVVEEQEGEIALAKIDIEGAEYALLAQTPAAAWKRIQAVALELHGDPEGKKTQDQFLQEMKMLGFLIEQESVCSYFLHR